MLPGSSTSLTALFHGSGSHLKLLECVLDGTGERSFRSSTPAEDRYIPSAKRNRRTTVFSRWQISFWLPQEQIPENCCQTFERRGGLYARRPVVCVPLTRQHRTVRLQWCREHHN
ncbi:hypothetical protein TNCV_3686171 [Trichonephila clavipes]|nr:hypothetical protein TNCV_3686171 [Trichonephila clavipes]